MRKTATTTGEKTIKNKKNMPVLQKPLLMAAQTANLTKLLGHEPTRVERERCARESMELYFEGKRDILSPEFIQYATIGMAGIEDVRYNRSQISDVIEAECESLDYAALVCDQNYELYMAVIVDTNERTRNGGWRCWYVKKNHFPAGVDYRDLRKSAVAPHLAPKMWARIIKNYQPYSLAYECNVNAINTWNTKNGRQWCHSVANDVCDHYLFKNSRYPFRTAQQLINDKSSDAATWIDKYLRSPYSNIDDLLRKYCDTLITTKGTDLASKDPRCGCFRHPDFYTKYYKDVQNMMGKDFKGVTLAFERKECSYTPCIVSDYKSYRIKTTNEKCPDITNCFQKINETYGEGATFNKKVTEQIMNCNREDQEKKKKKKKTKLTFSSPTKFGSEEKETDMDTEDGLEVENDENDKDGDDNYDDNNNDTTTDEQDGYIVAAHELSYIQSVPPHVMLNKLGASMYKRLDSDFILKVMKTSVVVTGVAVASIFSYVFYVL